MQSISFNIFLNTISNSFDIFLILKCNLILYAQNDSFDSFLKLVNGYSKTSNLTTAFEKNPFPKEMKIL